MKTETMQKKLNTVATGFILIGDRFVTTYPTGRLEVVLCGKEGYVIVSRYNDGGVSANGYDSFKQVIEALKNN